MKILSLIILCLFLQGCSLFRNDTRKVPEIQYDPTPEILMRPPLEMKTIKKEDFKGKSDE